MSIYAVAGNWGRILFPVCTGLLLFALLNAVRLDNPDLDGLRVSNILYLIESRPPVTAWETAGRTIGLRLGAR